MIRFGQATEDEVFITAEAAAAGVEVENTGSEPLVGLQLYRLRPRHAANLPKVGDHQR